MSEAKRLMENISDKFDEKALDSFVHDLNLYDHQHSQGTWLGRNIAGIFGSVMGNIKDEGVENNSENKPNEILEALHDEIKRNLTTDELERRHNPTLYKLGLNLESTPAKVGNVDQNAIFAVGEIRINIEDNEKYLLFLKSLKKETITATQRKIVEMVIKKLNDQVLNEYKFDEADERLLELFLGMRDLISEYERLGMNFDVLFLKDCFEYANTGYLREYILARKNGIFAPIGEGYALSTYHLDSSYDGYIQKWDQHLFEILDEIKQNPKAVILYNAVLKYANDCLAVAEQDSDMSSDDKKTLSSDVYLSNIRRAIKQVRDKLSKISYL